MSRTNMLLIPAGTFTLGSPTNEIDRYSDEGPQTSVTFTFPLWIAPYFVTQQEYQSIMGSNPSSFFGDLSRPEALMLMQKLPNLAQAAHRIKLAVLEKFGGHPYALVALDRPCSHQPLDHSSAHAMRFDACFHSQRANLADGWRVEMQRAAAQQFSV